MEEISEASPPRPAVSPLGWLPPRLHRASRAAGRILFLCGLLPTASAHAQQPPVAAYQANLLAGRVGDTFEVQVEVRWAGPAGDYDVQPPRPIPTAGLAFTLVGTDSQHDADGTRVRFRWQVTAREPGEYGVPELLPVVAYPAHGTAPEPIAPELPLRVTIRAPLSWPRLLATALGVTTALGGGVLGATAWRRRRRNRRSVEAAAAAGRATHDVLAERVAVAQGRRVEGDFGAYMQALLDVATEANAPAETRAELQALHERVVFAGHRPAEPELERAAALVRRVLAPDPGEKDTTYS